MGTVLILTKHPCLYPRPQGFALHLAETPQVAPEHLFTSRMTTNGSGSFIPCSKVLFPSLRVQLFLPVGVTHKNSTPPETIAVREVDEEIEEPSSTASEDLARKKEVNPWIVPIRQSNESWGFREPFSLPFQTDFGIHCMRLLR